MKELVWSDLHLDVPDAFVLVRESTTKNKRTEPVPLHPDLADALRRFCAAWGVVQGRVFRNGFPQVIAARFLRTLVQILRRLLHDRRRLLRAPGNHDRVEYFCVSLTPSSSSHLRDARH